MIRDEFNKQQKLKYSPKEMEKIRAVGERVYYNQYLNKSSNTLKSGNYVSCLSIFTGVITLICVLINELTSAMPMPKTLLIIVLALSVLMIVGSAIWLLFIRKKIEKRRTFFRVELERFKEQEFQKKKSGYELLKKNNVL